MYKNVILCSLVHTCDAPCSDLKEAILRFSYKSFFESPEFEIGFLYKTYTSMYVCLSLCSSGEKTVKLVSTYQWSRRSRRIGGKMSEAVQRLGISAYCFDLNISNHYKENWHYHFFILNWVRKFQLVLGTVHLFNYDEAFTDLKYVLTFTIIYILSTVFLILNRNHFQQLYPIQ